MLITNILHCVCMCNVQCGSHFSVYGVNCVCLRFHSDFTIREFNKFMHMYSSDYYLIADIVRISQKILQCIVFYLVPWLLRYSSKTIILYAKIEWNFMVFIFILMYNVNRMFFTLILICMNVDESKSLRKK